MPLTKADVKIRGGLDPAGNLFAVLLDFANHEATYWHELTLWTPRQYYGNVNLVDFDAFAHKGHIKVLGHTWKENGGSIEGDHFIIIDLGETPH